MKTSENQTFSDVSGGTEREYWTETSFGCHVSFFQKKLDSTNSLHLVRSFVEFVPHELELHGVDYFLSDKLNQDPAEKHFGRIRSRGRGSYNPTPKQYGNINGKVVVAKSETIQVTKGNTRGRVKENTKIDVHDERQLPHRQKKN